MIQLLAEKGELERTYIIVTADNGMAFPNAKASMHEYGIHVPLLIAGPEIDRPGRANHSLVSLIDLPNTILTLANVKNLADAVGKNLISILKSSKTKFNTPVFSGRERHTHARPDNVGYPSRAIRTEQYLYVKNFKPDRWPAGNPAPFPDPKGIQYAPHIYYWGFSQQQARVASCRTFISPLVRPAQANYWLSKAQ
jgi:uncharacterized sulfatase